MTDKIGKSLKDSYSDYHHHHQHTREPTPRTRPPTAADAKLTMADIYKKDDKGRYVMDYESRLKAIEEI